MAEKPTIEQIAESLKQKFGDSIIAVEQHYDFPVFIVKKEALFSIVRFLYDNQNFY